MRRQERYFWNGFFLGGLLTAAGDMLIQYLALKEQDKKFWDNWDGERTLKHSIIGAGIGGGCGLLVYCIDRKNQQQRPFDPDEHLNKVLNSLSLHKSKHLLNKGLKIRDDIIAFMENKYSHLLAEAPILSGSYPKGTAINTNFDHDVVLPMSKAKSGTLEENYNYVYETLRDEFSGQGFSVRKQKRSIGILDNKNELHFDIVPAREVNNYKIDKALHLYECPSLFEQPSYIKTNIEKQKLASGKSLEQKRIIKILKHYKILNEMKLPSIFIERIVADSIINSGQSNNISLYYGLRLSMQSLADNITRKQFMDIANSNNNLLQRVSENEKQRIKNRLLSDLDKISHDYTYLKEIFEL